MLMKTSENPSWVENQEKIVSPETNSKKWNFKRKIIKGVKVATLSTLGMWATYVGVWLSANKGLPDKTFEWPVTEQDGHFSVGQNDLASLLSENELTITPSLLSVLYKNEVNNKTHDAIGTVVSDISEWIHKVAPSLWTPNKSFGTWQIQNKAFLDFMREMEPESKINFIIKLWNFKIKGKSIIEITGYKDKSLSDFIKYIEKETYNISDADGALWFAMSILILEDIYKNIDINNVNIKQKYSNNQAFKYLLSERYKSGLVGAYRSTNYVRAKEDAPQQLNQNIDIVLAYLDGKISFDEITKSLDTNKNEKGAIMMDFPDGDIGKKYNSNDVFLQSLGITSTDTTKLGTIKNKIQGLSIEKKREVAALLANTSFETMYFAITELVRVHGFQTNVHLKIVDNRWEKGDIRKRINILPEAQLDIFIKFGVDVLEIITDPLVNTTTPVIQAKEWATNNNVNTIGRFADAYYGNEDYLLIPISDNTIQVLPIDTIKTLIDSLNQEDEPGSKKIEPIKPPKDNKEVTNKEIAKSYKIIRKVSVEKNFLPRVIIKNQSQVMAYMIRNEFKDLDGKLINQNTPAGKIPQVTVASFLSYDGKTPFKITQKNNPLNYIKKGEKMFIIIPTHDIKK